MKPISTISKIACSIFVSLLLFSVSGCILNAPGQTETSSEGACLDDENTNAKIYCFNDKLYHIENFDSLERDFMRGLHEIYDPQGILIHIYDTDTLLCSDILETRLGSLVVERCIGIVTDQKNGDGAILNSPSGASGYISYRNCKDLQIHDGTILVSYMVYDPYDNSCDGISERYDFVICRDYED